MSDYSPQERISQKKPSSEPERKSRKGIIIAVLCILLVILAVIALIWFLNSKDEPAEEEERRSVVVTPDNVDEILERVKNEKNEVGTYEVTMNTEWEFENGQSASSDAYVANAAANTNAVYFDVVRSDTGDTIYSSPIIPVGSHLKNIALDEALPAGTYACVVVYHLVDEDQKTVSTVNVNLKINIAN